MSENIIEIKDLKKKYRLGQIGSGTLTADLQSWWAKIRKKEDPNSRIGESSRISGETFWALNGINLTIKRGEAVGIIGGNGAGKSTMLKVLSRITAPSEGEIVIRGRIASMLEVGTGFNGEMTGRENIYMNGAILGMTKAEIDAKIDDIIEFSECGEFIDTPVKRYSSGMYVKLAFSVAAHLDSEIMIMDEVLAVGDVKFQQKCLGKMGDAANSEGKTVLYVSHNMATIRQLCTRCIVLKEGRIIFDGDVEKAIAVYMEENIENFINEIDFKNIPRAYPEYGKDVCLDKMTILNTDNGYIHSEKNLEIKLNWTAKADRENVFFRFVVFALDDTRIGMAESEKLCDAIKSVNYEHKLALNLKNFPEGKYKLAPVMYTKDNFGNIFNLDIPDTKIVITVESKEDGTTVWQSKYWGYIKYDKMKVI